MFLFQSCCFSTAVCILILLILLTSQVYSSSLSGHVRRMNFTIYQDFKAVLMYFSEAFLKGAKFGNKSLEGEINTDMANKFVQILDSFGVDEVGFYDPRFETLKTFKEQLSAGTAVASDICGSFYKFDINDPDKKFFKAKEIQEKIVQYLAIKDSIVIPSGWVGHAIVFIIKSVGNNLYNLTVVNSGQGLNHHYQREDPNQINPHLTRLWIEFKNIPGNEIFDPENGWFIFGLALINQKKYVENLKKTLQDKNNSVANYFYGTILANFKNYLVHPDINDPSFNDKLIPEQQSGSCSLYSLMAALLYYSDSLETFFWYRLKIGHVFLEFFLNRLEQIIQTTTPDSEDQIQFMNVLRNGFFSGGIRHLKGLSRALANLQFQYLEHRFPNEFKHAGLIGSGRSNWLADKKAAAIEIISSDPVSMEELLKTVKLMTTIYQFVEGIKFQKNTTHISDFSKIRKMFNNQLFFEKPNDKTKYSDMGNRLNFRVSTSVNIYQNIVSAKADRLEVPMAPLQSFDELQAYFEELFNMFDHDKECYFMRFLDLFKRLHIGESWALIVNHKVEKDLLNLQKMCKVLAKKFVLLSEKYTNGNFRKPTMDEITFLGHLQLLSWNIFRALHMIQFPESVVDWERLIPPQSLQSVLLPQSSNATHRIAGYLKNWPIKGFNDIENYKLYEQFIAEGRSEFVDISNINYRAFFPGPEWFINNSERIKFDESDFNMLFRNSDLRGIFEPIINYPFVDYILNRLVLNSVNSAKFECLSTDYLKFLTVLHMGQNHLLHSFPHYYNLMFTLQCIRLGASGQGSTFKNQDFWMETSSNPEEKILLLKPKAKNSSESLFSLGYPLNLFVDSNPLAENFYILRHSYAHPEKVGFTDIDTWFNYIRNAKSSKLFDNSYFQYMTDHLLNVPKYLQHAHRSIIIFDAEKAEKIILELVKTVREILKELYDDSGKMTILRREIIVRRAVNIAVITTRFISRANYEFENSVDWASLLAMLYNSIEIYLQLNSPILKLTESDISMLNFALCHMCFVSISQPETFINSVKLNFDYPYIRTRKTLARLHWFIAKMNYSLSPNTMIADDQFKYGFNVSPLERKEVRFFESLLKEKFLRYYLKVESGFNFRYHSGGYVVEISIADSSVILLINLATASIIENGFMVSNKSAFINCNEFQHYFPSRDHEYLINHGKAIVFFGIPVFILPTYKGSDYVLIQYYTNFWIFRKWNGGWYIWRLESHFSYFFEPLNYDWKSNSVKMFIKYKSPEDEVELIIFDEGAKDPVVRIVSSSLEGHHSRNSNFSISIPGLTDGSFAKIIHPDYLEMHFKEFAEKGITFACQESNDTFIIVYNNYRLPEEPSKPLVLMSSQNSQFWVQNIPNMKMKICEDQRIGDQGLSLPGGLVATFDEKKILLLPFAEV